MSVTVISLEGVLAVGRPDDVVMMKPFGPGVITYHAMKSLTKIVVVSTAPQDRAEHWLRVQGLRDHAYLYAGDKPLMDKLSAMRAIQLDISLVLHPDPAEVVTALRAGFLCGLWSHPSYARPEWRPDAPRTQRPWDEVVKEVELQRLALAGDPRVSVDATVDSG